MECLCVVFAQSPTSFATSSVNYLLLNLSDSPRHELGIIDGYQFTTTIVYLQIIYSMYLVGE